MLQQTRVETVRSYYERWMRRYPDLESLAAAELDDVLKSWEGLGYYSRARNLHRAVREVAAAYHGRVPADVDAFRALPGVGRYTAGAVMSIAFGKREPIVDGNVRRVFARLLDLPDPARDTLWGLAADFADHPRVGDVNQALMELGATVCTPRSPDCGGCPLATYCRALAAGTVLERPARKKKAPRPIERHGVAMVHDGERLLLRRRPPNGRLAGLWEFPGVEPAAGQSLEEAARRAAEEAGVAVEIGRRLPEVEHVFTHVTVRYQPFAARAVESRPASPIGPDAVWVERKRIGDYALPTAQHRILEHWDAAVGEV